MSAAPYPVETVTRIAREAGDLALSHFNRLATVPVESKGHLDLVTEADQAVERLLAARLQEAFPEDGVFGEEGAAVTSRSGRIWVVDPIDGTFNFVRGGDQWMVSIGLFQSGAPRFGVLYGPARNQMVTGGAGLAPAINGSPLPPPRPFDRGRAAAGVGFHPSIPTDFRLAAMRFLIDEARMSLRCCGSATISLLEVALGQVDGYLGMGESTWDVMAALPILHELGMRDTLDWAKIGLASKLKFAVGSPEFIEAAAAAIGE